MQLHAICYNVVVVVVTEAVKYFRNPNKGDKQHTTLEYVASSMGFFFFYYDISTAFVEGRLNTHRHGYTHTEIVAINADCC